MVVSVGSAVENDDTREEKRKQMVLLHSTEAMSGAIRGELHKLMELTYYTVNAKAFKPQKIANCTLN